MELEIFYSVHAFKQRMTFVLHSLLNILDSFLLANKMNFTFDDHMTAHVTRS